MLHVLGFILKLIGILILVILGILLLLIGVILFVPISYEATAEFPEDKSEIKVSASIHWLLRLLRVKVMWYKKELDGDVKIAWKRIPLNNDKTTKKEKKKKQKKSDKKVVKQTVEKPVEEQVSEIEENLETKTETNAETNVESNTETKQEESSSQTTKKRESLLKKIKCTFQNICDKIKEVKAKKDAIMNLINDPVFKASLYRVKKELRWIVRFLRPKKLKGRLHFGFEDPSTTGRTLAALSMIYPFTGDDMVIVPDFEQPVLDGEVYIKGRLYLFYVVAFIWNLVWDKNVRALYKKVKTNNIFK